MLLSPKASAARRAGPAARVAAPTAPDMPGSMPDPLDECLQSVRFDGLAIEANKDDAPVAPDDEKRARDNDAVSTSDSSVSGTSCRTADSTRVPKTVRSLVAFWQLLKNSQYVHMVLLLGVPIAFLLAFQMQIIVAQSDAIEYGAVHRDTVQRLVDCSASIAAERGSSFVYSGLSEARVNDRSTMTDVAAARETMLKARGNSDRQCHSLLLLMKRSSFEIGDSGLETAHAVAVRLAQIRMRLDAAPSDVFDILTDEYTAAVTTVNDLFDTFSRGRKAEAMQQEFTQLMVSRHVQNILGVCRGLGTALLTVGTEVPQRRLRLVREYRAFVALFALLRTVADGELSDVLFDLDRRPELNQWQPLLNRLMYANFSDYQSIQHAEYYEKLTTFLEALRAADIKLVHLACNADGPKRTLAVSSAMLAVSIVCSVVTSSLVMVRRRRILKSINAELQESRKLAKAVSRFVPANQLRAMGVRSITEVRGGDSVEVSKSVLFSDIRAFSPIAESKANGELFHWLQDYFDTMTKVVEGTQGFIDKFIGDAIFAVFTSPTQAASCAIGMHEATEKLNASIISRRGQDLVQIGIGVHHGLVCCGVFGDDQRLTCTLVSSDVTLTERFEGATKSLSSRTIVSGSAAARMDISEFEIRYLGVILVCGFPDELEVWDLFSNDTLQVKAYKHATRERFSEALSIRLTDPPAAIALMEELVTEMNAHGVVDNALLIQLECAQTGMNARRISKFV